jgi:glucose/mannose-6-phosphate isomerase
MNLDDLTVFQRLDAQHYYPHIESLPEKLQSGWELGQSLPLPDVLQAAGFHQILLVAMGSGAGDAAGLLAAYAAPVCPVPVSIHQDYDLPAWVRGPQALVIAISFSGNTEETLSAYDQARERGCTCLALTTGGRLAELAAGQAVWRFEHRGPARAALSLIFSMLLALFFRLDLLPDPQAELAETLQVLQEQQKNWQAEVPAVRNPAKRMAGQLVGRAITVFGSGVLAPVALRWKAQLNLLAKAWAQAEKLPAVSYTSLAGSQSPEQALSRMIAIFLRAAVNHPRNLLRSDLMRQQFMLDGVNTDYFNAAGQSRLAQQWSTLLMGEYAAFYLAMAYGVDPTPIEAREQMQAALEAVR